MTGGDLIAVREGEEARKLTDGFAFVHVHASRCGRYFLCGDHRGEYDLVLGCRETGKTDIVCSAKTKTDGPPRTIKNTHPRPYLTPDLKWAIFLSNRSGAPQVHAASVPHTCSSPLSGNTAKVTPLSPTPLRRGAPLFAAP